MRIKIAVTIDGRKSLTRAYVLHDPLGVGETSYWTDDAGEAVIASQESPARIRVVSENPVVRMIKKIPPMMISLRRYSETFMVEDGDTIRISDANRGTFAMMQAIKDIYDCGLREFSPWNNSEYPMTLDWNANGKIEAMFPDNLPPTDDILSYVQPLGVFSRYPIMHLRVDTTDRRQLPTVAHELGHALHFGKLPQQKRGDIEQNYIGYLITEQGHSFGDKSTSFVAFIEAFGAFAQRYYASVLSNSGLSGLDRHAKFWDDELTNRDAHVANTEFKRSDVEGAVYFALFVDYARTEGIGLDFVVDSYVKSQAVDISGYIQYIKDRYEATDIHYTALRTAAMIWGMPWTIDEEPYLVISEPEIFRTSVGCPIHQDIHLRNEAIPALLQLKQVSIEPGEMSTVFQVDTNSIQHTVPPRGSVTIPIHFKPHEIGICTAELLIESNAVNGPHRVGLKGDGVHNLETKYSNKSRKELIEVYAHWDQPGDTAILEHFWMEAAGCGAKVELTTTGALKILDHSETRGFTESDTARIRTRVRWIKKGNGAVLQLKPFAHTNVWLHYAPVSEDDNSLPRIKVTDSGIAAYVGKAALEINLMYPEGEDPYEVEFEFWVVLPAQFSYEIEEQPIIEPVEMQEHWIDKPVPLPPSLLEILFPEAVTKIEIDLQGIAAWRPHSDNPDVYIERSYTWQEVLKTISNGHAVIADIGA